MGQIEVWQLGLNGAEGVSQLTRFNDFKTLDAATKELPSGAYTTFRTYNGNKVLHLKQHLHRLEESADLAGKRIELAQDNIRQAMRKTLIETGWEETRFRIIVDLQLIEGMVYLLAEALHLLPEQAYFDGVGASTTLFYRDNPRAKMTDFIEKSADLRIATSQNINEVLMIGKDGGVLEGLSSNFFAVINGEVFTADEGVLAGTTRALVLEAVRRCGILVHLSGVPASELPLIQEAFITSVSRGVLPLVEIDLRPVGEGKPGPVTQRIVKEYNQMVESDLEFF